MFFSNKKEAKTCPGQKWFVWAFFIIVIGFFILTETGQIPENFIKNFLK